MAEMKNTAASGSKPFWRRGGVWIVIGSALIATAVAAPLASAYRGSFWAGHGGRHFHGGILADPQRAADRASFAAEWVLRAVDGTEDQQERARQLAARVVGDLTPLLERHKAYHEAFAEQLERPIIDRDALERIREDQMPLLDDASRLLVASLADFAEILTPEQRAELIELAGRAHGLHGGH